LATSSTRRKRDPETNLKSPTMMWDFCRSSPESLHQVTILFSDRGTPDGYRHMDGFSSHTFSLINSKNELFYVEVPLQDQAEYQNFDRDSAEVMKGKDPDYAQRDLFDAIAKGDFPKLESFYPGHAGKGSGDISHQSV